MDHRDIREGSRIGDYVLLEKLGEGPHIQTWRAEHHDQKGNFATVQWSTTPEGLQVLKNRAKIHAELDHPHIVKSLGLQTDTSPAHLAQEYISGRTLHQYIRGEGIFPPLLALDTMIQILDALEAARSKGFHHGHLSPENILTGKVHVLIDQKTRSALFIKITDFTVVSPRDPVPLPKDPDYQAPERANPAGVFDHRSDLYSAGVIFYEMITGTLPRSMDLPSELNPVIPPVVDSIVKKALSVDLQKRYPDARSMMNDLIQAREEVAKLIHSPALPKQTPPAEPKPPIPPDTPMLPRWLVWGFAGFILFALLGLVLGLLELTSSKQNTSENPGHEFTLVLKTLPAGAEIVIPGTAVAGTTPTQVSRAFPPSGQIQITLVKKFYQDYKLTAVLNSGSVTVRDDQGKILFSRELQKFQDPVLEIPTLTLVRDYAALHVTADADRPATVILDGRPLGQTPATLEKIEAGEHLLKVQWDKTTFVEEKIILLGRQTYHQRFSRPPEKQTAAQATGTLQILTDPPQADVMVDGVPLDKKTPLVLDRLAPGLKKIKISARGHQAIEEEVTIVPNVTLTIERSLKAAKRMLHVKSTPSGADVYIDGRLAGPTPLSLEISPGDHTIRIEKAGYQRQEHTVTENSPANVFITLEKAAKASLVVTSEIKGIPVFINQRFSGKTPLARENLEEGPISVRVMHVEKTEKVSAGTKVEMNFSLAELEMAMVPSGIFSMGRDGGNADESPARSVNLEAYYIDLYEVTNAKYGKFLKYVKDSQDHSFCHPDEPPQKDHTPQFWTDDTYNKPALPVVGVDWFDAFAYANWSGKRLPTEAEWEKAARGPGGFLYPWGQTWDESYCNSAGADDYKNTAPGGTFKKTSPYGCFDMAGNVWEFCADWYDKDYYSKSPVKNPGGPLTGDYKVKRGGSWLTGEKFLTTTARHYEKLDYRSKDLGFRCAAQ